LPASDATSHSLNKSDIPVCSARIDTQVHPPAPALPSEEIKNGQ